MKTLTVNLGMRSYPIHIGQGLLQKPELVTEHIRGRQVMVVTNEKIAPLYLDCVKRLLSGFELATVILPDGEQYKNLETLNAVFTGLLEQRFNRRCTLVALGGGWSAILPVLPPPVTSGAWPFCRYRPPSWHRSTHRWAGKRALTTHWEKT